jgi:transposase InsO family protein
MARPWPGQARPPAPQAASDPGLDDPARRKQGCYDSVMMGRSTESRATAVTTTWQTVDWCKISTRHRSPRASTSIVHKNVQCYLSSIRLGVCVHSRVICCFAAIIESWSETPAGRNSETAAAESLESLRPTAGPGLFVALRPTAGLSFVALFSSSSCAPRGTSASESTILVGTSVLSHRYSRIVVTMWKLYVQINGPGYTIIILQL